MVDNEDSFEFYWSVFYIFFWLYFRREKRLFYSIGICIYMYFYMIFCVLLRNFRVLCVVIIFVSFCEMMGYYEWGKRLI